MKTQNTCARMYCSTTKIEIEIIDNYCTNNNDDDDDDN